MKIELNAELEPDVDNGSRLVLRALVTDPTKDEWVALSEPLYVVRLADETAEQAAMRATQALFADVWPGVDTELTDLRREFENHEHGRPTC